jgi:hypothetical protein
VLFIDYTLYLLLVLSAPASHDTGKLCFDTTNQIHAWFTVQDQAITDGCGDINLSFTRNLLFSSRPISLKRVTLVRATWEDSDVICHLCHGRRQDSGLRP